MSRPLRIEYPGAWYHIMNRGGRYEAIFEDKIDYCVFLELLQEIAGRLGMSQPGIVYAVKRGDRIAYEREIKLTD